MEGSRHTEQILGQRAQEIDWSDVPVNQITCNCGKVFHGRSKYDIKVSEIVIEIACGGCDRRGNVFKVSVAQHLETFDRKDVRRISSPVVRSERVSLLLTREESVILNRLSHKMRLTHSEVVGTFLMRVKKQQEEIES